MESIVSNQPPVSFEADREHDQSQNGWIEPRMHSHKGNSWNMKIGGWQSHNVDFDVLSTLLLNGVSFRLLFVLAMSALSLRGAPPPGPGNLFQCRCRCKGLTSRHTNVQFEIPITNLIVKHSYLALIRSDQTSERPVVCVPSSVQTNFS